MSKLADSMRSLKIGITAVLLVLVLVFVIQNHGSQQIRFLFWSRRVSLSLALLLVSGAGFVAGFLWGARKARPPK